MIAVESLGLRFGARWIFRELDFQVSKGQRLAVLGRNGSGKSSLLRVLSGLQVASEGSVVLPKGELRNLVGYAALDMSLYPDLSVREHLLLTGSLRGCAPRTEELLDQVGLSNASEVLSIHLSTGMKVRLKIAMALQAKPPILMLDEPSASLDGSGRQLMREICDHQAREGCVILATNDPIERDIATHELTLDS